MHGCVVFVCVCTHAGAFACAFAHRGQRRMLGILINCLLPYSFAIGYLTEPGAKLKTSKLPVLAPVSVSFP